MSNELTSYLTGGGLVALATGLGWVVKLLLGWRKERREDKREGRESTSAHVNDSATVTALAMQSLKDERGENERLQVRMDAMEQENERLRTELFEQKRKYESEVTELKQHAQELQMQINDLVAQLARLAPPDSETA